MDSGNAGLPGDNRAREKTWVRIMLQKLGGALKSHSLELFTAAGDTKWDEKRKTSCGFLLNNK